MESFIYIILGVLTGVVISGLVVWFLLRAKKPKENDGGFILIQNQIDNLTRAIESKLGESGKEMREAVKHQFGESQKLIKDITEQITHVKEANRQVISVADQLKSLQSTLQNPKQRGVLGEYYLDSVLKNMFAPSQYKLQYKIGKGEDGRDLIADAVIFLQEKILPVDSKFSLENYNRTINESDALERERLEKLFVQDIKNRIDETAKYIRPADGTMDFAFMFIPSEAIYYDLLINKVGVATRDLIEYAFRDKKVIIVSPTSFMAYLQTVLQGLRALQIEETTKEIQKRVGELERHISAYDQYMMKLGNSLGTTVNHYNTAHKELGKIDKDVLRITGTSPGIEVLTVDKPNLEN